MPRKTSSGTEVHLNLEILTCEPRICTGNHPKFILSTRMDKFIQGYSRKKYLGGGGRRQTLYFSMGGWCGHLSNYMGYWCLKKSDYMGGEVLTENRLLMFDRYIKSNVPVSIKSACFCVV